MRKWQRAICTLKRYEWEALAQLLKQGYSFQDAYHMIQGEERLLRELENGKPLETLFIQGHHGTFYEHLHFFMSILSLSDAISAALHIADFVKDMRQTFIKKSAYPFILFLFSFMTLFLFSTYIIPQLMQSFDFSENMAFLPLMITFMQDFALILLGMINLICIIMIGMYISIPLKFCFLRLLRITHVPQQYCSYMLAGYYIQMLQHGIPTRHIFTFLSRMKEGSLVGYCASQMEIQLQAGEEIITVFNKQMWIEHSFTRYWQIGLHTQNMETALLQYQKRQETIWKQRLQRATFFIQATAYAFVALMVVVVYQIMMVPLQVLETM